MKTKIKYMIIILIIILILAIVAIIKINIDKTKELPTTADTNQTEENVLVVGIEKNNQTEENTSQTEQNTSNNKTTEEPEQEPERDASTFTQEIYNMNTTIGTIRIPKTKINLQVYSNSDPKKMEKSFQITKNLQREMYSILQTIKEEKKNTQYIQNLQQHQMIQHF